MRFSDARHVPRHNAVEGRGGMDETDLPEHHGPGRDRLARGQRAAVVDRQAPPRTRSFRIPSGSRRRARTSIRAPSGPTPALASTMSTETADATYSWAISAELFRLYRNVGTDREPRFAAAELLKAGGGNAKVPIY